MKTSGKSLPLLLLLVVLASSAWIAVLEIDQPYFFSKYDNVDFFLPLFAYNWQSVFEHKTIPLINYHQRLGHTYLTQGQTAVLSPVPYIAVGLSKLFTNNAFSSVEVIAVFYRMLGAIFMFLFLRQLKISPTISVIGALFWISYPYFITTGTFWLYENYALAYLPLNFLLLEKLIAKPSMKLAFLLAGVKSWFLLESYPEYTFMIFVFEVLFIWFVLTRQINQGKIKQVSKLMILYIMCLAVFVLSTFPLVLPTLEAQLQSANRAVPVAFNEFMGFPVTLRTFLDAQLFNFHPKSLWYASSYIYYIGFINLAFLLPLALKRVRLRSKLHHVLIYCCLAIIAFMLSTSLHRYLYIFPFNYFRRAEKYFPLFVFFLTTASAGTAFTIVRKHKLLGRQAIHVLLILSLAINVLVVWFNKEDAWLLKTESPTSITYKYIKPELGRVFMFTNKVDDSYTPADSATLYGINDFTGYESLINDINYNLTLAIGRKHAYSLMPDKKTLDYLSSWSVRYLQTRNTLIGRNYFKQHSQLKPLYQDDKILLYENSKALPYVYDAANPKQAVPHEFGVNEVNIYPGNNQPRRLIVNIAPLSRYVVYLDGKKYGRVVPALGPIAVDVPAKVGHVMIRYEDPLFRLGVGLCLATWLSLTLIYLINKLVTRQRTDYRWANQH